MNDAKIHKDYKRSFLAITVTMIMVLAAVNLAVPSFGFGLPAGADDPSWYTTVEGVLADDTYALYPYQKKNLKIGFSQFGEMINALPGERVGLEYDTRDPFAPPAGNSEPASIPQRKWFSGWHINITYRHATATPSTRTVWAVASHASLDTSVYGNGWIYVDNQFGSSVGGGKIAGGPPYLEKHEDPLDPGMFLTLDGQDILAGSPINGGRKTNGTATTMPIKVLYDGPRRYVAEVETLISDVLDDAARPLITEPLVSVHFTIDFNKVKKEVNVLKDVKLLFVKFQYGIIELVAGNKTIHTTLEDWQHNNENLIPTGENDVRFQGMYVQFSNRGEWDLGPAPIFNSYAHFYTDGPGEDSSAVAPQLNPTWEGLATAYDREYTLIRTVPPNKNARWGIEPDHSGVETYDLAQVISSDLKYVAFAGYWPSLSDWSIDGVTDDLWWRSLTNASIHREDCTIEPFTSPFTIGEWDFILTPSPFYDPVTKVEGDTQFRGVSVYGITDLNKGPMTPTTVGDELDLPDGADLVKVGDGDDMDRISGAYNIVDREVYYQLSEVFRPWDLKKATQNPRDKIINEGLPICKTIKPERHVDIDFDGYVTSWKLMPTFDQGWATGWPFHSYAYDHDGKIGDDSTEIGEWYAYSTFAERILVDGELLIRGKDYWIGDGGVSNNDAVNMTIYFTPGVSYDKLKILYSVCKPAYEWITVGEKAASVDSIGAAMVSEAFDSVKDISVQWGALDIEDPAHWTVPSLLREYVEGSDLSDYYYDPEEGDYRLALKDDWSTTVPIASSDIIAVGGPIANGVAQYFNEFGSVIYRGMPWYQGGTMTDLHPVSCWWTRGELGGHKGHDDTQSDYNVSAAVQGPLGYGVITAYKDINGTTGFMVWGLTGNDTFWISQALFNTGKISWKPGLALYKEIRVDSPTLSVGEVQGNGNGDLDTKDPIIRVPLKVVWFLLRYAHMTMEEICLTLTDTMIDDIMEMKEFMELPLIEFLQLENCGITSIVIEIDYSYTSESGDVHPTLTIVEQLGTKSEKPQHDP